MAVKFTLKVAEIRKETEDTFTFCFKQPALKKVKYRPGQYLTLVFRINGRRYIRPYSFSSAPEVDATLNLTIKRMYGGMVSNHIIDKVKVDDLVETFEPMGSFTLPDTNEVFDKRLVLWGSGSGITPLFSIAKSALNKGIASHITLVYGNRSKETTIFFNELASMQSAFPAKFAVWHFYTRSTFDFSSPYLIEGRIAPEKVLEVLKEEGDISNTFHFICGPEGLKRSVKEALSDLNIDQDKIFSEDFEVVKDPKDFEGIETRDVKLVIDGVESLVEVVKGKSILEAGLDAMLELNYSCQTGDCMLCKGYLAEGDVKTIGVKKTIEMEQHYCLMCCSYPLTDNVSIEIK